MAESYESGVCDEIDEACSCVRGLDDVKLAEMLDGILGKMRETSGFFGEWTMFTAMEEASRRLKERGAS